MQKNLKKSWLSAKMTASSIVEEKTYKVCVFVTKSSYLYFQFQLLKVHFFMF